MKKSTTAERLNFIISRRNLKQVDILRMATPYCKQYGIKLTKSDLSQYLSGKVEPGQYKLTVLGLALNVSETWLMGYDVPMERTSDYINNEPYTDKDLKVALFGGDSDVTDEMWQEVKQFAEFVKQKHGKKQ